MSAESIQQHAESLLRQMLGEDGSFRPGQWDAIEAVAIKKSRALVVQRTGWGKSLVYFLATKLLREQGAGPTLLISPLLSLMRNQLQMTKTIGISALTINSSNRDEWDQAEKALSDGSCDVLLVSPERLNNKHFIEEVLPKFSGKIGLFVVDEAHCISDWGHDFRPDYRRIVRIIKALPKGVPVLGTTATANDRVVKDVSEQLGEDLVLIRGSLRRKSLRLQNLVLSDQAERMAWLVENLPRMKGSGIVYCLTTADADRVAEWLRLKGIHADAYHAKDGGIDRGALEDSFLQNKTKILVATVALGMGFDKPDIGYVVHFQRPGSVVAYYQQVGRAGRALDCSYGILLSGKEDDDIQDYFIETAFPPEKIMQGVVDVLAKAESMSIWEILRRLNCSYRMIERTLKILEVEGAVGYDENGYFRTPNPWKPDSERIRRVVELRRAEQVQMQEYVRHKECLMEFLQIALDDVDAGPCGVCSNCQHKGFSAKVSPALVKEAQGFLKRRWLTIEPRKTWVTGVAVAKRGRIPVEFQNAEGRTLCHYGDAGWGQLVKEGKLNNHFVDELVEASVDLILNRWKPDPPPQWMTGIPSKRHTELVPDFCKRLASRLGIEYCPVLIRKGDALEQKKMLNSAHQANNVLETIDLVGMIPDGAVLLVDDIVDSRWTLTVAGYLLREKGCGEVYPYTLATSTSKGDL